MEQQAEWVGELQEQVQRLEESVKDLKPQLGRTEALADPGGFKAASRALEEGLQGDRRSVARGVNALWKRQQQREWQRGPERDFGPSR